jgi:hypothetical protein
VVFWPLDDIELVDWTTTNKFARLCFCEDTHHSSILKLAIKKTIQKSTNWNFSSKLFEDDSNDEKISLLGLCLHTEKHTVDIFPYSQLCCFPYWFAKEHNCDMHPYIMESHYVKYAGLITSACAIDTILSCIIVFHHHHQSLYWR